MLFIRLWYSENQAESGLNVTQVRSIFCNSYDGRGLSATYRLQLCLHTDIEKRLKPRF